MRTLIDKPTLRKSIKRLYLKNENDVKDKKIPIWFRTEFRCSETSGKLVQQFLRNRVHKIDKKKKKKKKTKNINKVFRWKQKT